ncbi:MAG: AMP-binding protein, partial [Verrucomicrobia bacterium]|nr:AMP-binding protein [Verrucomicrobiota bacterium]
GKTALVCGDRRHTYSEINAAADKLAFALKEAGVRRGDRVVIWLHNSFEAVIAIFAAVKASAVFVPVNRGAKNDKLSYILNNCRASALVVDPKGLEQLTGVQLRETVPSLHTVVVCGDPPPPQAPDPVVLFLPRILETTKAVQLPRENIDRDLACLIYTSGTTGEPKGVMSDHSNVAFASASIMEYLGSVDSDIVLCVLPLSFDYGLYQLLMTFWIGGTLVLENSFAFPAMILKRIQDERVTGFPGVPTVFAMLLNMDLSRADLSSIRYVTNTAAALPPTHVLELARRFPGARVHSMYGLTETKRTLQLPPERLSDKPDSVGIPIPGTEAWVQDDSGRRLQPGEVGELVVRGRHVMRGYWEAPQLTAARYRPGPIPGESLCFTGDLFRMDEEGFFYFVGRKDDIIKSRGEKVAPKEVEAALHALPGVVEAAVVGVPDPVLGQAVRAFVIKSNPDLTEAAILAHCRKNLEDFMVPKGVVFRDSFPRSASGKVRKEELL